MAHTTVAYPNGIRNLMHLGIFLWLAVIVFLTWNHSTGMLFFVYILPVTWQLFKAFRVRKMTAVYRFFYHVIMFAGLWSHDFGWIAFSLMLFGLVRFTSKLR